MSGCLGDTGCDDGGSDRGSKEEREGRRHLGAKTPRVGIEEKGRRPGVRAAATFLSGEKGNDETRQR